MEKFKKIMGWVIPIVLAVALGLFIKAELFQFVKVDGASMAPNLHNTERVMLLKRAKIRRDSVVVFNAYGVDNTGQPVAKNTKYVKRVIGLPGDTVTYKNDGALYVNGKYVPQTFISHKQRTTGTTSLNLPEAQGVRIGTGKSFKVPAGKYFVLGDNRAISNDSRYYGFVPRGKIDGVVKVPFWDANHRVINDYWKKVNQD
nr:signal peptidase I [Ligilactobacillus hohenheimensis]